MLFVPITADVNRCDVSPVSSFPTVGHHFFSKVQSVAIFAVWNLWMGFHTKLSKYREEAGRGSVPLGSRVELGGVEVTT